MTAPESGEKLSRRQLLRRGLWGAVLLGTGGLLIRRCTGYEVADDVASQLTVLRAKEVLILSAITHRVLRGASPSPDTVEVGPVLDRVIARLDRRSRSELMQLLSLIEHLLPIRSGHAARFTRLDGAAQDEVLQAMERSSIGMMRGAFDALKSLCCMAYYSTPAVWASIGYDGPLVGRPPGGFR